MCNVISRLSSLTAVDALPKLQVELYTDTAILKAFEGGRAMIEALRVWNFEGEENFR
jgi:hypothetical protein